MSAVEEAYALLSGAERAMWRRAAAVAQDGRRTEVERALALDVTALLVKIGQARAVLSVTVPPAIPPAKLATVTDGGRSHGEGQDANRR